AARLLAAGEADAALANAGVVGGGELGDEAVGVGGPGGGDNLLHRGVGVAVADVVEDAVVEQERLLLHEGEVAAEAVAGDGAEVAAVEGDGAGGGVVEAQEQVEDGALAGAAGAAEGD